MSAPTEFPEIMKPNIAAQFLGVCRATLDNWTVKGLIPVIRFGDVVRYSKKDLLGMSKREPLESSLKNSAEV